MGLEAGNETHSVLMMHFIWSGDMKYQAVGVWKTHSLRIEPDLALKARHDSFGSIRRHLEVQESTTDDHGLCIKYFPGEFAALDSRSKRPFRRAWERSRLALTTFTKGVELLVVPRVVPALSLMLIP